MAPSMNRVGVCVPNRFFYTQLTLVADFYCRHCTRRRRRLSLKRIANIQFYLKPTSPV